MPVGQIVGRMQQVRPVKDVIYEMIEGSSRPPTGSGRSPRWTRRPLPEACALPSDEVGALAGAGTTARANHRQAPPARRRRRGLPAADGRARPGPRQRRAPGPPLQRCDQAGHAHPRDKEKRASRHLPLAPRPYANGSQSHHAAIAAREAGRLQSDRMALRWGENPPADIEAARERLIDAAEECLQRFGITKTTVEDVAATASVSRATVYRYFRDRDELILAVLVRDVDRLLDRVKKRFTPEGPWPRRSSTGSSTASIASAVRRRPCSARARASPGSSSASWSRAWSWRPRSERRRARMRAGSSPDTTIDASCRIAEGPGAGGGRPVRRQA